MIVDNFIKFKKYMAEFTYGTVSGSTGHQYTTNTNIVTIDNSAVTDRFLYIFKNIYSGNTDYLNADLSIVNKNIDIMRVDSVIPSSETSFNASDTNIANQISGLTIASINQVINTSREKTVRTITVVFNNTTNSDITINSVGLIHRVYWKYWSNASENNCDLLMAELVLTNPFTKCIMYHVWMCFLE